VAETDTGLDPHERREVLRIARATLKEYLATGSLPPGAPHRAALVAPASVFVTLRQGSALRGCVGTMADLPLYRAVQDMAVAAATRDPRFSPVSRDELTLLTIEVSVLGPRKKVASPAEVQVGTHGVVVSTRERRGLLLPQVATENGWDAATFVERCCEKAGLPRDAWREATIEVFTAQVFEEAH